MTNCDHFYDMHLTLACLISATAVAVLHQLAGSIQEPLLVHPGALLQGCSCDGCGLLDPDDVEMLTST